MITLYMYVIVTFLLIHVCKSHLNFDMDVRNNDTRILSRKKRYLIFPEGSSIQLVFDWVVPFIDMPNIFTIGITLSLAWQLPHDPYEPFRKPAEAVHRRVDKPEKTSGGWILQDTHNPSYQKQKFNYNYLKNSASHMPEYMNFFKPVHYSHTGYQNSPAYRQVYNRKYAYNRHVTLGKQVYVKKPDRIGLHPIYNEVHRRTRRDLFMKIEKFFTAKMMDGKSCLLKAVCQVNQDSAYGQGAFWEEIIKTIFRNKPSYANEDEDEYDKAANDRRNCSDLYPSCNFY